MAKTSENTLSPEEAAAQARAAEMAKLAEEARPIAVETALSQLQWSAQGGIEVNGKGEPEDPRNYRALKILAAAHIPAKEILQGTLSLGFTQLQIRAVFNVVGKKLPSEFDSLYMMTIDLNQAFLEVIRGMKVDETTAVVALQMTQSLMRRLLAGKQEAEENQRQAIADEAFQQRVQQQEADEEMRMKITVEVERRLAKEKKSRK